MTSRARPTTRQRRSPMPSPADIKAMEDIVTEHAGPLGKVAGSSLVAEVFEQFDPGADEGDASLAAGPGKGSVFREEAVSGVNCIDTVGPGQSHDALNVEVTAERFPLAANQIGLVSLEPVQRKAVFVGIDRHGPHTEFVGGTKDANGDFAAIGDEEFFDGFHRFVSVRAGKGGGSPRRAKVSAVARNATETMPQSKHSGDHVSWPPNSCLIVPCRGSRAYRGEPRWGKTSRSLNGRTSSRHSGTIFGITGPQIDRQEFGGGSCRASRGCSESEVGNGGGRRLPEVRWCEP